MKTFEKSGSKKYRWDLGMMKTEAEEYCKFETQIRFALLLQKRIEEKEIEEQWNTFKEITLAGGGKNRVYNTSS